MKFKIITVIFLFSVLNAVAGVIPGFEPVWETVKPQNAIHSPIKKERKTSRGSTATRKASDSTSPLGRTWKDPATGMEFVWVPGGCYRMGCESNSSYGLNAQNKQPVSIAAIPVWQWPLVVVAALLPVGCARPTYYKRTGCYSKEQPAHRVCLDGFYMGKYEVTQGEYKAIMGSNPSKFDKNDRYPVERVSWYDAREFIKKLNSRTGKKYRLPTEAEWEYAARSGGKAEKYAGSNSPETVAWFYGNSGGSTHEVGTKAANGLGLYDMSGNVWELCRDGWDSGYYKNSPVNNPPGPSSGCLYRVLRGGSFLVSAGGVRSERRGMDKPSRRAIVLGFRLVLSGQ